MRKFLAIAAFIAVSVSHGLAAAPEMIRNPVTTNRFLNSPSDGDISYWNSLLKVWTNGPAPSPTGGGQPASPVLTNISGTGVSPGATNASAYVASAIGRGTNAAFFGQTNLGAVYLEAVSTNGILATGPGGIIQTTVLSGLTLTGGVLRADAGSGSSFTTVFPTIGNVFEDLTSSWWASGVDSSYLYTNGVAVINPLDDAVGGFGYKAYYLTAPAGVSTLQLFLQMRGATSGGGDTTSRISLYNYDGGTELFFTNVALSTTFSNYTLNANVVAKSNYVIKIWQDYSGIVSQSTFLARRIDARWDGVASTLYGWDVRDEFIKDSFHESFSLGRQGLAYPLSEVSFMTSDTNVQFDVYSSMNDSGFEAQRNITVLTNGNYCTVVLVTNYGGIYSASVGDGVKKVTLINGPQSIPVGVKNGTWVRRVFSTSSNPVAVQLPPERSSIFFYGDSMMCGFSVADASQSMPKIVERMTGRPSNIRAYGYLSVASETNAYESFLPLRDHLANAKPSTFVVSIGYNDWGFTTMSAASFFLRYSNMLRLVTHDNPDMKIVVIPPIGWKTISNGNGETIAQFKTAVTNAAIGFSRVTILGPNDLVFTNEFAPDNIHPNEAGNARWAYGVYKAVMFYGGGTNINDTFQSQLNSKQQGSFVLTNFVFMGITNIVSANANTVITTNNGVLTLTTASGGGSGGTNFPPVISSFTNVTVGSGVRQSIAFTPTSSNQFFNVQGTPVNGEDIIGRWTNSASTNVLITFRANGSASSFRNYLVGSNDTSFSVPAGDMVKARFTWSTNYGSIWEMTDVDGPQLELAAGSNVTFTTNGGTLTIASSGGSGTTNNLVYSGGVLNGSNGVFVGPTQRYQLRHDSSQFYIYDTVNLSSSISVLDSNAKINLSGLAGVEVTGPMLGPIFRASGTNFGNYVVATNSVTVLGTGGAGRADYLFGGITNLSDSATNGGIRSWPSGGINPANATASPYSLIYDNTQDSLGFYGATTNTLQNIGQETWVRVVNQTGSIISNGWAVYVVGSTNTWPVVAPARANFSVSSRVLGLATEQISNGSTGMVTIAGVVNGVDTSLYTNGTKFWLSANTAGFWTNVPPSGTNFNYFIGYLTHSNATAGRIAVQPTPAIDERDTIYDSTFSGAGPTTLATWGMTNNSVASIEYRLTVSTTTGSTNASAVYTRIAAIACTNSTCRIIGTTATPATLEDSSAWNSDVTVSGATFSVNHTGTAGTGYRARLRVRPIDVVGQ